MYLVLKLSPTIPTAACVITKQSLIFALVLPLDAGSLPWLHTTICSIILFFFVYLRNYTSTTLCTMATVYKPIGYSGNNTGWVFVWLILGWFLAWCTFRALDDWTRIGCWPEPSALFVTVCVVLWVVLLCLAFFASCTNGWLVIMYWRVSWWLLWLPFLSLFMWAIVEMPISGAQMCGNEKMDSYILHNSCARCSDGCTGVSYMDYMRVQSAACTTDFASIVSQLSENVLRCESGTLVTGVRPGATSASIYSIRGSVLWDIDTDTSKVTKHGSIPQLLRDDIVSNAEHDTNLLIATGSEADFVQAHGSASNWKKHMNYDMNFQQWGLPKSRTDIKRAYMRSVENLLPHWKWLFRTRMEATFNHIAAQEGHSEMYEDIVMSTMNITCRMHLADADDVCDHDTVRLFYDWARTAGSGSKYTLRAAKAVMQKIQEQSDAMQKNPNDPAFENTFMYQWMFVMENKPYFTAKTARIEVMHNILAMGAQLSNLVAQTIRAHACAANTVHGGCSGIPHGFMGTFDAKFEPHKHFMELMRWISPGLPFTMGSAMAKSFSFPSELVWNSDFYEETRRLCSLKVNTMPSLTRWLVGEDRHSSIGVSLRAANRVSVPNGNRFQYDRYDRSKGLLIYGNDVEYDVQPGIDTLGPKGEVPGINTTVVSHRHGWAPFGTGYRRCPGESMVRDALEGLHALLSSGKYTFELNDHSVEANSFAFLGLAPSDGLKGSIHVN